MKQLILISTSMICSFVSCSQNQQRISPDQDLQSMREDLTFSIDNDQNIKALRIILSGDSIKLNDAPFQNTEQLLQHLNEEFVSIYQVENLDSIIAIQLYFSPNTPIEVHDTVYFGIEKLYQESRDFLAGKSYNKPYSALSKDEIGTIEHKIPFYLNEYELILYKGE